MPLIFFLLYLLLEVYVSLEVANLIGAFGLFLEIILSALLGFGIIINFRIFFVQTLMALKNKQMSYEDFAKSNIFRIIGAILLLLPGALSDICGLVLQIGGIGFLLPSKGFPQAHTPSKKEQNSAEIIDVEIIPKGPTCKK